MGLNLILFMNKKGEKTMRMNEILSKKGIELSKDRNYETMTHQAKDGKHRYGLIRKEMRIYSPSVWGAGEYSIVGVTIDTWERNISVDLLMGTAPVAGNLFLALLADRDVRRLIKEYQSKGRVKKYKIWEKEGVSGCEDIFITIANQKEGFAVTNTKKLCHISMNGRLNEGLREKIYIGDFVELVVFLGLTENMRVQDLRKMAGGVKYIIPKFVEEVQDFCTDVSEIL